MTFTGLVIEGEIAQPTPAPWTCPSCTRRHVDDVDSRVTARMCAADPRTGRPHPPVAMVRACSNVVALRLPSGTTVNVTAELLRDLRL